MIELSEVIRELRQEMQEAIAAGTDKPLRFELGPIELEASVAVERQGGAGAKVRFWVIELGGEAKATHASTQRIKLSLQPRLAGSGAAPWVSGEATDRER
jgi:hypothetical protein